MAKEIIEVDRPSECPFRRVNREGECIVRECLIYDSIECGGEYIPDTLEGIPASCRLRTAPRLVKLAEV